MELQVREHLKESQFIPNTIYYIPIYGTYQGDPVVYRDTDNLLHIINDCDKPPFDTPRRYVNPNKSWDVIDTGITIGELCHILGGKET